MGCPEVGERQRVSELSESFRGLMGLGIERDLYFNAKGRPLSVYAEAARAADRIVESGPELDEAAGNRTGASA